MSGLRDNTAEQQLAWLQAGRAQFSAAAGLFYDRANAMATCACGCGGYAPRAEGGTIDGRWYQRGCYNRAAIGAAEARGQGRAGR